MNLSENPQFYTDATLAIRDGESAIRALEGNFDPRVEDYAGLDDRCTSQSAPPPENEAFEPRRGRGDDFVDYEEEQFGGSRGRAAFRRSAVKVAGAQVKKKKVVEVEEPEAVIVRDSRPYVADFMDRLDTCEENLRRYSRWNLYEDFRAARRRLIDEPQAPTDGKPVPSEKDRFEAMVAYLYEVQHQDGIDERLRLLRSSDSLGLRTSVQGLPLRDGWKLLGDDLMAFGEALDAKYFADRLDQELERDGHRFDIVDDQP